MNKETLARASRSTSDGKPLHGIGAAKRFIELLTGDTGNPLSWRMIHDSDKSANAFSLDNTPDNLVDMFLERQEDGYGVFAVVNGGGHRDAHIDKVRAVFIDGDDVPLPETWHVEPHFIVQRDETHWHAYWLTMGMTPDQFTEVQRRLAAHYGTDPTISNPSRVMRVPGFAHLKNPNNPRDVILIEANTRPGGKQQRFSYEEISAELPEVPDYVTLSRKADPNRDKPVCELDLPHNIEEAEKFLNRREPAIADGTGNNWTYKTACMIRDMGVSELLCHEIMLHSEWNTVRCEPAWAAEELASVIANAYRYGENRPGCKRAPLSMVYDFKNAKPMDLGDYAEWRAGWLREQKRMADQLTRLEHDVDEAPTDINPEPTNRRSFKPRSEAEQDAQPDPEWLIKGVLQKETLALFYGPENSFKSFLVLDMVLSAAAGLPWASYGGHEDAGGFTPKRPLTTVYIAGEGSHGIEKLRRPAWRQHRGVTEPLPFYTVNEMPFFKSADEVERLIAEIREAEIEPDIIVVDTAARAMLDLDENSARDTGLFVAACDLLKREFGCAVVVVHHSGKDNAKGARGSTNLPASFDARFMVTGDTGSLVARIKAEKQKDGEPWSMPIAFQGEQVAVGLGRNSLVFNRVAPNAAKAKEADPLLELALATIADNRGKMPLSMNGLAEEMARRYASEELSDGELEKAKEGMRNYLKKAVRGDLAKFAHKASKAKSAPWVFEDRSKPGSHHKK